MQGMGAEAGAARRLLQAAADAARQDDSDGSGGPNKWYIVSASVASAIFVCLCCAYMHYRRAAKSGVTSAQKSVAGSEANSQDLERFDAEGVSQSRQISTRSSTDIEIANLNNQIKELTQAIEAATTPRSGNESDDLAEQLAELAKLDHEPASFNPVTISLGFSRSESESSSWSRQQSETSLGSNSAKQGRGASGVGSGLQLTAKETIERQLRELDNRIHRLATADVTRDEIQEQEKANRKIMNTLAELAQSSGGENLVEGESQGSLQEEGKVTGAGDTAAMTR